MIRTEHYNLYHITNNGQCSWWEYASKIFKLLKIDVKIEKTVAAEYKTRANRPKYSVLDNYNLRKIDLDDMPQWDQALKGYLFEMGYIAK